MIRPTIMCFTGRRGLLKILFLVLIHVIFFPPWKYQTVSSGNLSSAYAAEITFGGDINGDFVVDVNDLADFILHWLEIDCGYPDWCDQSDRDGNHRVDSDDLAVLARDWLKGIRSSQSHLTHTGHIRGPYLSCSDCHDTNDYPNFKSGIDSNEDGKYSVQETDVCNACHSPDGKYDGVNDPIFGAKNNWAFGVYDNDALRVNLKQWCAACHDEGSSEIKGVKAPPVAGDGITYGFFVNGHGQNMSCTECHDTKGLHIDAEHRTYSFNSGYYGPGQSGVAYAAAYRLRYVGGQVPLMIPANYNITFGYDAGNMRDSAFRLCMKCHDVSEILDDTSGDGIRSNFKAGLPDPPRNYSYAWGSGVDINEHVAHIMNYIGPFVDSDWDINTTGPGGSDGADSMTTCSSCHNVHGPSGNSGSTNEAMIRDGQLAGRSGYGFSYVIEDMMGYPFVTSTGANRAISAGAIFRNNTADMCGGSMCHGNPQRPPGSRYDASGSSWGTYLEYYRPAQKLN